MDNDNVISIGKELGLKDVELKAWVEQERVRLRDERAEERNALKEEMTLKQQLIEQERAAAREQAEQQQKLLEQDQKVLELKLRLQENAATAQATENSTSSMRRELPERNIDVADVIGGALECCPWKTRLRGVEITVASAYVRPGQRCNATELLQLTAGLGSEFLLFSDINALLTM
ncbi:hypothetical protein MTO96_029419 [Rhipicephalus appendiculatus]